MRHPTNAPARAPAPVDPARDTGPADALARVLDDLVGIPGTKYRVGLDGLLGLIPGVGDAAGALMSATIVIQAARMGVSRPVLLRMLGNLAIDSAAGAVPVLGDLFDFAFKANRRNVTLLRAEMERPGVERRGSTLRLAGVAIVVLVLLGGMVFVAFWVARQLMDLLRGAF